MPTLHTLSASLALLLALALGAIVPSGPARAVQIAQVLLRPIATDLARPVGIVHAGDDSGRLFIVEQGGTIKIYDGTRVLPTPFLDLTALVQASGSEQGLLGLAFHPDYQTNGLFYVNYTGKSGTGDTVIARYQVSNTNPNIADPNSARTLLTIPQPQANHNGGQLQFGPDGYLYIATGDGGGGGDEGTGHTPGIGNGQDLNTLLGKILRIDVNNANTADGLPYDIPAGNPFAGDNDPNTRAEIWAYGLRNPWRFSFDRQTGDMFIGDVGQGSREEIDFQPAGAGGANYGWRRMEGSLCFNPPSACNDGSLTLPILEYATHQTGTCAVTGGYRYRGVRAPQLYGAYLYADYCSGQIWSARSDESGRWVASPLLDTDAAISTFGEDQLGEIYVVDHGGTIYQISAPAWFAYLPLAQR